MPLRGHEVADPTLEAALTMFRRAANYVARLEDIVVFNGRSQTGTPGGSAAGIPDVFKVTAEATTSEPGILNGTRLIVRLPRNTGTGPVVDGRDLISGVIRAVGLLEGRGQLGPFACVLGQELFNAAHDPNTSYVLPRDRILPEIRGPLLRASTTSGVMGVVISLCGDPVQLVVASDIRVQYLQTTTEPRYVFRVVEKMALRIKERDAIVALVV